MKIFCHHLSTLICSLLAILFFKISNGQSDNPPVGLGQWRIHLPYNSAITVADGKSKVYCAGKYGLFSYNKNDASIERYSRVTGLNDLQIATIRYNSTIGVLLIAYQNSNVDLLFDDNTIVNLSDIERKNIIGNKNINHIMFVDRFAYLSCGFGIVVIDLIRKEVKDTYYIGPNGGGLPINQTAYDEINFYAATDSGIYIANANSSALFNFESWGLDTTIKTVLQKATSKFSSITAFAGKIFATKKGTTYGTDSLLVNDGSSWSFFYNLPIPNIKFETELNHLILFSDWGVSVEDYSLNTIANVNGNSYNNGAPISGYVDSDGLFWIADGRNGLVRCSNNNYDFIYPNGPYNIATWSMAVSKDNLWVTGGAINLQAPTWSTYGTYLYNDYSNWKNFNRLTDPGYDTLGFPDEVCVAIDPQDTKHAFVGTWGSGLLEYRENGIVSVFNSSNSTLQPIYNPTFHPVYVGGIAFDKNNSLWIANPMNPTPISVRYADGSWKSFQISGNFANVATFGLIVDSYNQKWIIARGSGGDALGLGVFNENDPSNSSDDTFKLVNSTSGQGGLVSLNIYSIAEDKDGAIWIGSDQGVSVIYNPGNVFTGGNYDAQQILIEQEGQAQYLLATDYVMAIAVDGANRKWFGTLSGGVFLMSADGTKQLLNFNMDNSPLLSNRIYSIAIDPNTGEVYFGTDAGICSYRGDATEGGETCEDYYVFPNPVAHNYHGPIAIKGLVSNAFVKITDLSGQVVYQTKANGGLATWNGNNFQGVRAKTGVYLVYITNDDGSSTCVTKMVFTN